jgi:hypothetical protein
MRVLRVKRELDAEFCVCGQDCVVNDKWESAERI